MKFFLYGQMFTNRDSQKLKVFHVSKRNCNFSQLNAITLIDESSSVINRA